MMGNTHFFKHVGIFYLCFSLQIMENSHCGTCVKVSESWRGMRYVDVFYTEHINLVRKL